MRSKIHTVLPIYFWTDGIWFPLMDKLIERLKAGFYILMDSKSWSWTSIVKGMNTKQKYMFIWRRSIYAHSILWKMCHLLMAKIDIKLNSHVPHCSRHLFTASSSHQKTNFHHHFMTSNILLSNNTDFISIHFHIH